eukprot:jgi/Undpi1/5224/HiC_scaffold_2.g00506.m1
MAAPVAAFLALLSGAGSVFAELDNVVGSIDIVESSCNSTIFFSIRSAWASEDEPCHQKISMEMWTFMKAGASPPNADAQHVYDECMRQPDMGLVELITPEDWDSTIVDAGPGEIVGETEHAATLLCKGAEDFEAICNDDEVKKAWRVRASTYSTIPLQRTPRRLQTTTSEAGTAHQVQELIDGLEELGCLRTKGEDQTLCVMSDSFDNKGAAGALQEFGDLPPVDVVKTFADDIGVLANAEGCDVIVDDVGYFASPSFRDGVIANAVDAATQDNDVLYFTSAGNDGLAHRFVSVTPFSVWTNDYKEAHHVCDWECSKLLFTTDSALCPSGSGTNAHVFNSATVGVERYLLAFDSTSSSPIHLKWDDDEGSARPMAMFIWSLSNGAPSFWSFGLPDPGSATISIDTPGDSQRYYISVHADGTDPLEAVSMHLIASDNQFSSTGATSGSMYGQPCATNAFSVAAIPFTSASGDLGAFADPEPSSVEDFSSRGPCIVDAGQGLTTRNHPVTTAADGLQTSTSADFNPFFSTSAAAPVAAAIATIIRAACFPRVVTFNDMIEMLTDYDYTIDVTSDAAGAAETYGVEAGYGIISAQKMCLWVAQNCPQACPNTVGAHGDPHLVGLEGQKFDFTGQSNNWYALLSAWDMDHVNMRVTAPIADLPIVTYITGITVQTEDDDGVVHTIVIFVTNPNVLETSCTDNAQPCIGNGALTVLLDGVSMARPGEMELGPGVSVMAANIPGECRPFGFEKYWQRKIQEAKFVDPPSGRRRLTNVPSVDRWIAEDPAATNPAECKQYVSNAMEHDSLFAHQSDHVSFQLVTPRLTMRLNHGKLHQLPERDPTDTFDIPDHTTFQMNLGFMGMKGDDKMQGIIGETAVPTIDEHGAEITSGLKAIRGQEHDYKVDGPLGKTFNQIMTGVK